MERYSILEPKTPPVSETPVSSPDVSMPANSKAAAPDGHALRLPDDNGGKSLADVAQRDLEAALQLLADRAQYITAASGAAIAMRDGDHMVCRASAGPSAPELGAELQVNSGLSGESVRTRQILRCDDAETDHRVNRESCRALGIASVVVLPLLANDEVVGVFELFSSRACAFEERDVAALQRLAEMIRTVLENTEAIKRTVKEISEPEQNASSGEENITVKPAVESPVAPTAPAGDLVEEQETAIQSSVESKAGEVTQQVEPAHAAEAVTLKLVQPESEAATSAPVFVVHGVIRKCEKCGFPVSQGRTICVDCETGRKAGGQQPATHPSEEPLFVSQLQEKDGSWLSSHKYLLGIVLMALIALAVLAWMR